LEILTSFPNNSTFLTFEAAPNDSAPVGKIALPSDMGELPTSHKIKQTELDADVDIIPAGLLHSLLSFSSATAGP